MGKQIFSKFACYLHAINVFAVGYLVAASCYFAECAEKPAHVVLGAVYLSLAIGHWVERKQSGYGQQDYEQVGKNGGESK